MAARRRRSSAAHASRGSRSGKSGGGVGVGLAGSVHRVGRRAGGRGSARSAARTRIDLDESIVLRGLLDKLHERTATWSKRFVVLSEFALRYYSAEDDARSDPRDSFPLSMLTAEAVATGVEGQRHCFRVNVTSTDVARPARRGSDLTAPQPMPRRDGVRTVTFAATTAAACASWLDAINQAKLELAVGQIKVRETLVRRQKRQRSSKLVISPDKPAVLANTDGSQVEVAAPDLVYSFLYPSVDGSMRFIEFPEQAQELKQQQEPAFMSYFDDENPEMWQQRTHTPASLSKFMPAELQALLDLCDVREAEELAACRRKWQHAIRLVSVELGRREADVAG